MLGTRWYPVRAFFLVWTTIPPEAEIPWLTLAEGVRNITRVITYRFPLIAAADSRR